MTHLPFTLLAYFLNAASTTIDKLLLTKSVSHPLIYVFYLSLFSLIGILPLPLTHFPPSGALILASVSVLLWTLGAYFMFTALKVGLVTRVVPMIGTLIPFFLLVDASITHAITQFQIIAVILLIIGLIFLTIKDWSGDLKKDELLLVLASALLFTISYILLREAYLRSDFLSAFVYSRFVIIPLLLIIVLVPPWRRIVFAKRGDKPAFKLLSKPGFLMMGGQSAGGAAELLLMFSVSLASPALVNSLQGTQYAFLFIFSLILAKRFPGVFKEKLSLPIIVSKISGIGFIAAGLFLLAK